MTGGREAEGRPGGVLGRGRPDEAPDGSLDEALSVARSLAASAGIAPPERAEPLPCGRNNRVYRVDGPEGPLLLKRYFSHPGDLRDRLGAECAFLRHAGRLCPHQAPSLLAGDRHLGAALCRFVAGRPFVPGGVAWGHVARALDFVRRLNAEPDSDSAAALPEASESAFSLPDHLRIIGGRVDRLGTIDPSSEEGRAALEFHQSRLVPAWERVRCGILDAARDDAEGFWRELPPESRCVSPSDFGFHNALIDQDGRIRFLDFEYAGWDDPAKLACDFFLQPRVPVPLEHRDAFLDALAGVVPGGEGMRRRADILHPAYVIKWCCILLGEFLPVSGARRRFAAGAAARSGQLRKAAALLESLASV